MVTSREVGYDAYSLRTEIFDRQVIAPFDGDQVAAYAERWFQHDDATAPDERRARAASFVRDSEAVEDLRRNPLMLSLLCAIYTSDRYLPRNRAQVYERCAVLMFDRWDTMRGIPMPVRLQGYVRGAVQQLAWEMFGSDGAMSLSRSVRVLRRFLLAKRVDEDEVETLVTQFLEFCTGRAWLLVEVGVADGEPIYGFAHRTFLEFFTAERLVRHHPSPEALWAALAPHLGDGAWTIVAQLALQLIDRNVEDGGEATVELALDAWPSANPDALAGFLAGATGHLELSSATLGRIVKVAVERTREVAVPDRYVFWYDDRVSPRTAVCDNALIIVLYDSLDANLAHIGRYISDAYSADDDHARYLLTNLTRARRTGVDARIKFWREVKSEVSATQRVLFDDWLRRMPWGRLRDLEDESDQIGTWFDTFGPEPLYTGDCYERGFALPGAVLVLTGTDSEPVVSDAAHRLRDRLLSAPTPWLSADRWYDALDHTTDRLFQWVLQRLRDAQWPADSDDLATLLVLSLPYIETIETRTSLRNPSLVAPVAALVSGGLPMSRLDDLPLAPHHLGYLKDWAAGRKVLG